jgi:type IV secretory pathway VirJ component
MNKTLIAAVIAAFATAPAFAAEHKQAEARAMAEALSTGINQNQETKDALSLAFEPKNPNAAVPSIVSGGGNGGWGNIGSTLTGTLGKSVSGR